MRIAINQVKEGNAQAAVSAGNTGALMATARFVLKTIPGIERPAIAKFLPSDSEHVTLALDLGGQRRLYARTTGSICHHRQRAGTRAAP